MAEAQDKKQATPWMTMVDVAALTMHAAPVERIENETGIFARSMGQTLCGRSTLDMDAWHPVGDRMRYAGIVNKVTACQPCASAVLDDGR